MTVVMAFLGFSLLLIISVVNCQDETTVETTAAAPKTTTSPPITTYPAPAINIQTMNPDFQWILSSTHATDTLVFPPTEVSYEKPRCINVADYTPFNIMKQCQDSTISFPTGLGNTNGGYNPFGAGNTNFGNGNPNGWYPPDWPNGQPGNNLNNYNFNRPYPNPTPNPYTTYNPYNPGSNAGSNFPGQNNYNLGTTFPNLNSNYKPGSNWPNPNNNYIPGSNLPSPNNFIYGPNRPNQGNTGQGGTYETDDSYLTENRPYPERPWNPDDYNYPSRPLFPTRRPLGDKPDRYSGSYSFGRK